MEDDIRIINEKDGTTTITKILYDYTHRITTIDIEDIIKAENILAAKVVTTTKSHSKFSGYSDEKSYRDYYLFDKERGNWEKDSAVHDTESDSGAYVFRDYFYNKVIKSSLKHDTLVNHIDEETAAKLCGQNLREIIIEEKIGKEKAIEIGKEKAIAKREIINLKIVGDKKCLMGRVSVRASENDPYASTRYYTFRNKKHLFGADNEARRWVRDHGTNPLLRECCDDVKYKYETFINSKEKYNKNYLPSFIDEKTATKFCCDSLRRVVAEEIEREDRATAKHDSPEAGL